MSKPPAAVFLSYASQDAAAAQGIAAALRSAGVEVWFDREELRGGDAWDAKIRRQIQECALFIPLVSANTQARPEGYFRFEWKLAVDRSHLMSDDHPFLFPLVIDGTSDAAARVPDRFRERQWLHVPGGRADAALVARVRRLLTGESLSGHRPVLAAARARPAPRWWPWAVAAALALAAGGWFAARRSAPAPPARSIAVLPFTNMSEDKGNAFFADGVQEDILTNLAQVGGLEVISRTSVMGYRDTTKPVQQIGRELGVAYVLEGSVRRAGNKVRVTGQLINVRTDQHLWGRSYDRDVDDIFAIQAALARDIAGALHAALTPEDTARLAARPTENLEAYEAYLRGREIVHDSTAARELLLRAQSLFERAVELDPRFALAWANLARVHLNIYGYIDHTAARFAQAKAALDTALQLAPGAQEVVFAHAQYLRDTHDDAAAAIEMQRLARAYPNSTEALMMLAFASRDLRESLGYLERARRLDPRNAHLLENMSGLYLTGRHYDEAAAFAAEANALQPPNTRSEFRLALIPFWARGTTGPAESFLAQLPPEARRTDPDAIMALAGWAYATGDAAGLVRLREESGAHWRFAPATARFDTIVVAQAYIVLGQSERARPLLEQNRDQLAAALAAEPGNDRKWADLALIQVMLGDRPAAKAAEDRARQLASWTSFAMLHAWSGDKDVALAELARTIPGGGDLHETNVHDLRHQIGFWPLWGDPRFEALLNDPKNNVPLF